MPLQWLCFRGWPPMATQSMTFPIPKPFRQTPQFDCWQLLRMVALEMADIPTPPFPSAGTAVLSSLPKSTRGQCRKWRQSHCVTMIGICRLASIDCWRFSISLKKFQSLPWIKPFEQPSYTLNRMSATIVSTPRTVSQRRVSLIFLNTLIQASTNSLELPLMPRIDLIWPHPIVIAAAVVNPFTTGVEMKRTKKPAIAKLIKITVIVYKILICCYGDKSFFNWLPIWRIWCRLMWRGTTCKFLSYPCLHAYKTTTLDLPKLRQPQSKIMHPDRKATKTA